MPKVFFPARYLVEQMEPIARWREKERARERERERKRERERGSQVEEGIQSARY